LQNPPIALLEATRRIAHNDLTKELHAHHIPIHATEYPLTHLLRFLRELIPQWHMTMDDQNLLSSVLSRNAASHIVSIPLFIALWGALADLRPASDATPLQKAIETSKAIIKLQFPDLHFVYGLIYQRLGHDFQTKCHQGAMSYLKWEDLKREMITVEIKLSEGSYGDFKTSLLQSGIYLPYPDNKIHVPMLLAVAEDFMDYAADLTEEVNDIHECTISSTVARMLREICPKWPEISAALVEQQSVRARGYNQRDVGITEHDFMSVLHRNGGIIATAEDSQHFWEYLVQASSPSPSTLRGRETPLSLKEIELSLGPREQTYSSLSNLMRGKYTYSHKANSERRNEDHMDDIFHIPEESNHASANFPQNSSLAHFPWQVDEAHPVSNLRQRALAGLHHCSPEQLLHFVKGIYSKESSFNFSVARSVLQESFSEVGIHFSHHDMEALWLEIQASLHTLKASDLIRWLQLEQVPYTPITAPVPTPSAARANYHPSAGRIDPAKHTGVLDPRHSSQNPRHIQPQSSWEAFSEDGSQDSQRKSSLADYAPPASVRSTPSVGSNDSTTPFGVQFGEPDHISTPVDDGSHSEQTQGNGAGDDGAMSAYKMALTSLLRDRPQLAHAFRRISNGSGLGRGEDVCDALLRPPFSINLSEDEVWNLVCRMAGVDRFTLPARVYLRFNDVISFLEREAAIHLQPKHDPRQVSIQKKLEACKNVRGSKIEMMEQSHILRTRLRHIRQRGAVTSWDAVPDICYPQEFTKLMESIGLILTQDEVIFVYRCVNKEHEPAITPSCFNQCRYGMPLGESIAFMSTLCSH
jgi:hypothetical protein